MVIMVAISAYTSFLALKPRHAAERSGRWIFHVVNTRRVWQMKAKTKFVQSLFEPAASIDGLGSSMDLL